MLTYEQTTGRLTQNANYVGTGYSGNGVGKNNSARQAERQVGPIPQGMWLISGPPIDTPLHGPFVLHLLPNGAHTFGRDGFLMHGDSIRDPGNASQGCIIMSHTVREYVWNSGDRDLEVIA